MKAKIGMTLPRCVSPIRLASQIEAKGEKELGNDFVGHKTRLDDSTTPKTMLKIMTDGILLEEAWRDVLLQQYSLIIIDEVHERTANIDMLLALLREKVAS